MQGCCPLSEVFGGYEIGPYSGAGLLWDVAGSQRQQALDAHVQANGRLGEPEGLFVISSHQVQGIVPAIPSASDIAMQQGQGHGRSAWTVVGEAARQRWHKGESGLFRQVATHVKFGIDPRLKAANELQNHTTAVDNRAIALFLLHPTRGQRLLDRTAHFWIGFGDKAAELASAAGQAALFLDQGEQGRGGSGGSIGTHGIVQETLPLRATQAGEPDTWVS